MPSDLDRPLRVVGHHANTDVLVKGRMAPITFTINEPPNDLVIQTTIPMDVEDAERLLAQLWMILPIGRRKLQELDKTEGDT
jgi:hypothetical protein